jgi:preprotein translocase subunit SecD
MERLRESLRAKDIATRTIVSPDPRHIEVEGVSAEQDSVFRQAADDLDTMFERGVGTHGTYRFTMRPGIEAELRRDAVVRARETIERRVNELGVTEPGISTQGAEDNEIAVQLPGVDDVERAKNVIGTAGFLELRIVEEGHLTALPANGVSEDFEVVPARP